MGRWLTRLLAVLLVAALPVLPARDFDGTDDEIILPDAALWDSLTAVTVSVWVNVDSVSTRSDFFTRWGDGVGNSSWNLLQGVTLRRAEFFLTDGSSYMSSGADTADLPTGVWIHLAGTWSSGGPIRLWRNGVNTASSGNLTFTTPNTAIQPRIGNTAETTPRPVNGRIAEVAIWNVALTANEMIALANGTSPSQVRRSALLGYWPLWGAASPEADLSGNRNNGTVTGAVAADHCPCGPRPQ